MRYAITAFLALSLVACGKDGRAFPTQPPLGIMICPKPDTMVVRDTAGVVVRTVVSMRMCRAL